MTRTRYLRVRNWDKFQHHKDGRRLPWIKLYDELLEDYDFLRLTEGQQCLLMKIWLLANRTGNKIPNDERFIRGSLGVHNRVKLRPLVEKGFLEPWRPTRKTPAPAKNPSRQTLDKVYDPSSPEVEVEKEREESTNVLSRPEATKARPRDPLWDALTEELGFQPSSRSERGRWNAALKELREADATASDVHTRCVAYRRRWPGVTLTPTALSANWGSLNSSSELSTEERRRRRYAHLHQGAE